MTKSRWPQEPKRVLLEASKERLQDAKALFKVKRYGGAVYLAGYVIECLLKAVICEYLRVKQLPNQYTVHNLESLLAACGLKDTLRASPMLAKYFDVILEWTVTMRYRGSIVRADDARKFMEAVTEVRLWLLSKRK